MNPISIKGIVEFRGKSDKAKQTFVAAMKKTRKKGDDKEGGGDYWISSISAISSSFRLNNLQPIIERKSDLEERYGKTEYRRTKEMYRRNIDILYNYESFDLKKWRPSNTSNYLRKERIDSILTIKGLPIKVTPHHVFAFDRNGMEEIGAIWFISKLNGFKIEELGMFADVLYRYLKIHYSREHMLSARQCLAVDVFSGLEVNYAQLENGDVPEIFGKTLGELKNLL